MLLHNWLVNTGWQQCVSDPCIYTFRIGSVFATIALYVDDIPTACNDTTWLASFKARLGTLFKIKDLGALQYPSSLACTSHVSGIPAPYPWTNRSTFVTSWINTA
jgi:hypothetical protein